MAPTKDPEFPCAFVISTPFPTHRLAVSALKALQVDEELSPMVRRTFSLATAKRSGISASSDATAIGYDSDECKTVLRTEYKAKTNRMLRVAVNGFMESLGVVLGVMERLDVDVLAGHST